VQLGLSTPIGVRTRSVHFGAGDQPTRVGMAGHLRFYDSDCDEPDEHGEQGGAALRALLYPRDALDRHAVKTTDGEGGAAAREAATDQNGKDMEPSPRQEQTSLQGGALVQPSISNEQPGEGAGAVPCNGQSATAQGSPAAVMTTPVSRGGCPRA